MTKSELASLAHVTTRTLAKWLKPLRPQLRDMGVPDQAKVLPFDAVHFISSQFHITIDENDEQENGNKPNFPQKAEKYLNAPSPNVVSLHSISVSLLCIDHTWAIRLTKMDNRLNL